MSTGSTTTWGIPLFGDNDPVVPIQAPFNAQSNALDTALTQAVSTSGFPQYATKSALPGTGPSKYAHATVNADGTAANNGDYWWNGTAWIQIAIGGTTGPGPFAQAAGSYTITSNIAAAGSSSQTIAFPTSRFSATPFVLAIADTGRVTCSSTARSTTGATIVCNNWSTAAAGQPIVIQWWAIQMLSTGAAG